MLLSVVTVTLPSCPRCVLGSSCIRPTEQLLQLAIPVGPLSPYTHQLVYFLHVCRRYVETVARSIETKLHIKIVTKIPFRVDEIVLFQPRRTIREIKH